MVVKPLSVTFGFDAIGVMTARSTPTAAMSDHAEDRRIVAEALGDSLSSLGVRLVVDGHGCDFGSRDAARVVALIDGEFHRLLHLDAETGRGRRQRPANADFDIPTAQ